MQKSNITLFPYLLVRIAGMSYTDFLRTNLRKTPQIVEKIWKLEQDCKKTQEEISRQLYSIIPTIIDSSFRKTVISVRRDVYNSRSINYVSQDDLRSLPQSIQKLLTRYKSYQHKLEFLNKKGESLYNKETIRAKKEFYKLIKRPSFQKGILLSSESLFQELQEYIQHPNLTPAITKVERSLMEYLSRMATKTSPFSTFTNVGIAQFGNKPTTKLPKIKSKVRLNHAIFKYICNLLYSNRDVRKHFPIKANFTIRDINGEYSFFTQSNNQGAIQKIAVTSVITKIYEKIRSKSEWTYKGFLNDLIDKKYFSASYDELEIYIDNLFSYGFLEYSIGIEGLDPDWNKKFRNFLTPLSNKFSYIKDLILCLAYMESCIRAYETAPIKKRIDLLNNMFIRFRDTCYKLHIAANLPKKERETFSDNNTIAYRDKRDKKIKNFQREYSTFFLFSKKSLLYEDSYLEDSITLPHTQKKTFDQCLEFLKSLLDGPIFSFHTLDELNNFFVKNYPTTSTVNALDFYEKYIQFKKSYTYSIENKDKYTLPIKKIIKSFSSSRDIVNINEKNLSDIGKQRSLSDIGSFSVMTQISDSTYDSFPAFITATPIGFGRNYSRFLYLLEGKVQQELKSINNSLSKMSMYSESSDASFYNANIHSPLMPYRLILLSEVKKISAYDIPITDVDVAYNTKEKRVFLINRKNKKEIRMFDLSFELITRRLDLYSFLSNFTLGHFHLEWLLDVAKQINQKSKSNFDYPRIIYKDNLLLQRKGWVIRSKNCLIHLDKNNPWSFYRDMYTWTLFNGLPKEVFMTPLVRGLKSLSTNHSSKKEMKPQYINFDNPILATIPTYVNTNTFTKIEEMFPAKESMMSFSKKKYAIEVLAQWQIH